MALGVRVFKTWQIVVATDVGDQGVLVVFDRDTPEQAAFVCDSRTAREIGRGLIEQAREAEKQKTRSGT